MSAARRTLLRAPLTMVEEQDSRFRGDEEGAFSALGTSHWRSLGQLAPTDESNSLLHREFPASEFADPMSRRSFLSLMGASLALATLAGCRRPVEKIVSYAKPSEEIVLGNPEQFATVACIAGSVTGVLVTAREGRPIKVEGNPYHPSSRGGTNSFLQASILGLYDPDRSKDILNRGVASDYESFLAFWRPLRDRHLAAGGVGLAVLSGDIVSPSLARLRREFGHTFPKARWVVYESVSDENIRAGIRAATGGDYHPVYAFDKAKVILSLDSDFLMTEADAVANARAFADGRRVTDGKSLMNRLYAVESNFTVTGANADHRLRLKCSRVSHFAAALGAELEKLGLNVPGSEAALGKVPAGAEKFLMALARDLYLHRGNCLVVAGRGQPAVVHTLVCAMNAALGNVGTTVGYLPATEPCSSLTELAALTGAMKSGQIETLFVLGGNPVYDAPADLNFSEAFSRVPNAVVLSLHNDETGRRSSWLINQAHFLESWGDARSADGTLALQQPLIEPLFGGHSDIELAGVVTTGLDRRGYELAQETWKEHLPPLDFEKHWRRVLHDGMLAGSAQPWQTPAVNGSGVASALANGLPKSDDWLEVVFRPSYAVGDGRYSNNGWLQELPDPMTKLTWDNAALISPKTAERLGRLETEEVIRLTADGRSVEAPAFILPGHADDTITLTLGYGREKLGGVADGAGFDAGAIRTTDRFFFAGGASALKTGKRRPLATSQNHHSMEGRPIVREGSLDQYQKNPDFAAEMVEQGPAPSLWKEHTYDEGNQWGMTIDLNTCTGCNACAIACQSENNIPIVGREQVRRGREMHWIRLDRYFTGDADNPQAVTQPVACQQCEMAPCEQVCPVAATSHDQEGLNVMTYNRCIGTRYCSNNCPYKVRRFNFFNYTNKLDELVQMAQNPDVTVRSRGVMEKCTYCVQRINRGKHNAKMEDRDVRDGEIVTACQAACPSGAIVFGNLNDPESRVSKLKKDHRRYDLLAELNTRPRTSYLAKIRNPNPELEEA